MRCFSAQILLLSMALLASTAGRSVAGETDTAPPTNDQTIETGLIVRGQSQTTALPPPQLRVAQTYIPQADSYSSGGPPCPPLGPVCLPTMDPYAACPPQTITPWQTCQFGVFGEFLYLKPRDVNIPFAVPQNGILPLGSAPIGPVGTTDPGYKPGFRAGGYFGLGQDARISASYTWFKSTTSSEVDTTGVDVVNPLVLFPGTFNAGSSAQQATANYGIRFQLIDIDYQVVAETCDRFWWGYSVGARFARLTQNFDAQFPFGPPDGTINMSTGVTFNGIGPRAGVEGERILFHNCGLRAYGKSSASFLVGNFNSTYEQSNQFAGTVVNTSLGQERIVPVLDFELGLAWLSPGQHVRISGGYLVAAWFNTVNTSNWIQSVQDTSYRPGSNTITFDGLAARAEVKF